jgi:hypothetical protein
MVFCVRGLGAIGQHVLDDLISVLKHKLNTKIPLAMQNMTVKVNAPRNRSEGPERGLEVELYCL